jgi:hypothetical protein
VDGRRAVKAADDVDEAVDALVLGVGQHQDEVAAAVVDHVEHRQPALERERLGLARLLARELLGWDLWLGLGG